jgi:hypothetical protein
VGFIYFKNSCEIILWNAKCALSLFQNKKIMMKEKKVYSTKRNSHTYKCIDEVYIKARKRAKSEKTTLLEEVEKFVTLYSKNKKP